MYKWLSLLLLLVLCPETEAQITTSLQVSWRTEQNPLDPKRGEIDIPYLHVVYHNESKTDYYLVRRDESQWIFPMIYYFPMLRCPLLGSERRSLSVKELGLMYQRRSEQVRSQLRHTVRLRGVMWDVDQYVIHQEDSDELVPFDPDYDWGEMLHFLQDYLYGLLNAQSTLDSPRVIYAPEHQYRLVSPEPSGIKGPLRQVEE